MYTNLLFVEDWVKNLTQEVKGLIIEQPYEKEVNELGESYTYREITVFQNPLFLKEYTSKALSTLSKLDIIRDIKLISELRNELREGQFDDLKTRSLNNYTAKVLDSFSDLWMVGFDFGTFYTYLPKSIMDTDHFNDGVRYYYPDEPLELGNVLYRIRSFFKYSGLGFKSDPNEYTIESVLREYAKCDSSNTKKPNDDTEPTEPGVKLQWKGDKTDLAEVVYALYKAERITDTSTGKDVTKKLLAKRLGDLFCIDLTDMETPMKGRKSSNKAHYDGKTFTRHLAQIVDNLIKIR